jgi:hypothetical protein
MNKLNIEICKNKCLFYAKQNGEKFLCMTEYEGAYDLMNLYKNKDVLPTNCKYKLEHILKNA